MFLVDLQFARQNRPLFFVNLYFNGSTWFLELKIKVCSVVPLKSFSHIYQPLEFILR